MTVQSSLPPLPRGRLQPVPTVARWRSVHVNPYLYAAVLLVLFLGTVQVSQAFDVWTTSGKVTGTGDKIVATGRDPSEIKGWMTIEDVTIAYGVSVEALYARFEIPSETPAATPVKDLEKIAPAFSTEGLRTWLREQASQVPASP